jgi:hypothetical protein
VLAGHVSANLHAGVEDLPSHALDHPVATAAKSTPHHNNSNRDEEISEMRKDEAMEGRGMEKRLSRKPFPFFTN